MGVPIGSNQCPVYPNMTGATVVAGAPLGFLRIPFCTFNPPVAGTVPAQIAADTRVLEHLQYVRLCGGGPFTPLTASQVETSDAIRIGWSNL